MSMSALLLMACSKQANDSLDGEYYWINENRNEVAFVISGDTGNHKTWRGRRVYYRQRKINHSIIGRKYH